MAYSFSSTVVAGLALLIAAPASAAAPRDTLLAAAYGPSDKAHAIAMVEDALAVATARAARNPRDREAVFDEAMATGYHAKLTRGAADAKSARKQFEALVAASPNDPEPLLALAGWHLESVHSLGGFLASTALGAKKSTGLAVLDRAVKAGGNRPVVTGFAALLRILTDPSDVAVARRYAEAAAAGTAVNPEDQTIQRAALRLLVPLRAGDGNAASALAAKLLPFGRFG